MAGIKAGILDFQALALRAGDLGFWIKGKIKQCRMPVPVIQNRKSKIG